MLIDHIGFLFFPQVVIFRIIGRLALPIFCLGVAQGFIHTSNFYKYLERLIVFALIAQFPFGLAVNDFFKLNIIFGFALALIILKFLNQKKYLWALPFFALPLFIEFDYGLFSIAMILCFYFFRNRNALLLTALTISLLIFNWNNAWIHGFVFFGVLLAIYWPKDRLKLKLPKMFFYWFYPLHLLILYLIRLIL